MSEPLYKFGGLRFWSQEEIELREAFTLSTSRLVTRTLSGINGAWRHYRTEGPCLSPRDRISAEYSDDDLFQTNHIAGGAPLYLRAETTPSSYAYARYIGGKMPLCVWQSGKVFRRETNDGASASKLRFNDFHQLEFQCIYREDTKADYRKSLLDVLGPHVARFTGSDVRTAASDRLPSYSESTIDIEALHNGHWREVASCSIRTDFSKETRVCEIAFGLCRIATIASEMDAT
jgi:glycyl-tRNA synthetase